MRGTRSTQHGGARPLATQPMTKSQVWPLIGYLPGGTFALTGRTTAWSLDLDPLLAAVLERVKADPLVWLRSRLQIEVVLGRHPGRRQRAWITRTPRRRQ